MKNYLGSLETNINEFYNKYEESITDLIKHLIDTGVGINTIDWTERTISESIYKILEQINMAEPLDLDWLMDECKQISDGILEHLKDEHNYPCCGGRGCVDCLAGGWRNFI